MGPYESPRTVHRQLSVREDLFSAALDIGNLPTEVVASS